jgi:hypothetical protein
MLPRYNLWKMSTANRSDDNKYSTLLIVRRLPICGFSVLGKNQPAHLSRGQPWPIRSERVCLAAIFPGFHVHISLPCNKIIYLDFHLLPTLTMNHVSILQMKNEGALCTSWYIECAFLYEKYIHLKFSERLTSMVSSSSVIGGVNFSSSQEFGKSPAYGAIRFAFCRPTPYAD